MLQKIESTAQLDSLITRFYLKGTQTNNYLLADAYTELIATERLFCIEQGANAILLVDNPLFFRLYFYLNDLDSEFEVKAEKPITMELLYRGAERRPLDLLAYWQKAGFSTHLTRDQLFITYDQIQWQTNLNDSVSIKIGTQIQEAEYAHTLLEDSLDIYTGDHMELEAVQEHLQAGNLLMAYTGDSLCGVLQMESKKTGTWLGHVAVDPAFRGQGIAKKLVDAYLKSNAGNEKAKYQLWVIEDNEAAYRLYRNFGFKYAGRSTVSMLRID